MIKNKIEISYKDADLIFHCAFRYALGRQTYIVSDVAQCIFENWDNIPLRSQKLIVKELQSAIEEHDHQRQEGQKYPRLGMQVDYDVWKKLHNRLTDSSAKKNIQ